MSKPKTNTDNNTMKKGNNSNTTTASSSSNNSKYSLPVHQEDEVVLYDNESSTLSRRRNKKDVINDDDEFEINEKDLAKPDKSAGEGSESWHDTYNTSVTFVDRGDESIDDDDDDDDDGNEEDNKNGDGKTKSEERKLQQSTGSLGSSVNSEEIRRPWHKVRIQQIRRKCGKVVNDPRLQLGVVILIIGNAILMGLATFDFVRDDPDVDRTFNAVDKGFLVVFTIELLMQFIYHGLYLLKDGWLVFDLVIIVASWSLDSLQIIRTFRIFRALRLITRVQTLKKIVTALFAVMPRMTAISALLALIFYIYGVMCTYLFQDLYERGLTDEDYFSRLDITCFTLFQIMTMEDWASVARQVMAVYSWAWMVFVTYLLITAFIVYNLVIAVVCDAVADVEHEYDQDPLENLDENHPQNVRRIMKLKSRMSDMTKSQTELLQTMHTAVRHLEMTSRRQMDSTDKKW